MTPHFHADLAVLVLGVLEIAGRAHGYQIAKAIAAASRSAGGQIHPRAAELYPVLHRLEDEGLITAQWVMPRRGGLPRRVYEITERGRCEMEAERAAWEGFAASVRLLIGVKQGAGHGSEGTTAPAPLDPRVSKREKRPLADPSA